MSFIASKTYILGNGTDYTPGASGGPITDNESWVINIHILVTNADIVEITHAGGVTTKFPAGSLVAGAIYPYSVASVVLTAGDADSILGMAPNGKIRFF